MSTGRYDTSPASQRLLSIQAVIIISINYSMFNSSFNNSTWAKISTNESNLLRYYPVAPTLLFAHDKRKTSQHGICGVRKCVFE